MIWPRWRPIHDLVENAAPPVPLLLRGRAVRVFEEVRDGAPARRRHALSKLVMVLVVLIRVPFIVDLEDGMPSLGGDPSFLVSADSLNLV